GGETTDPAGGPRWRCRYTSAFCTGWRENETWLTRRRNHREPTSRRRAPVADLLRRIRPPKARPTRRACPGVLRPGGQPPRLLRRPRRPPVDRLPPPPTRRSREPGTTQR